MNSAAPATPAPAAAHHPVPHAPRTGPTSPQAPWSVAEVSEKIRLYVARLGEIWVEGQIVQFRERPGAWMQYLTLRDVNEQVSLSISMMNSVIQASPVKFEPGARVLVHGKFDFFKGNGSLSLRASEIRPVGIGELLARIEHLRQVLAAEGLFDQARKQTPPFLPRRIGLITGRNSDAMHDVIKNAQARWAGASFEVREVAVQGSYAVRDVMAALAELDAIDEVEVIVIARGGGAFEDLLPFSDEALVRAVAAARTPIVSAIGHEQDTPLIDHAADVRASTPTDAAKRIVPDVARERLSISSARRSMVSLLEARLQREQLSLSSLRTRPVLAHPQTMVDIREERLGHTIARARTLLNEQLLQACGDIGRLSAELNALSPASTLERGYAVVQTAAGVVVRTAKDAPAGTALTIRLAKDTLPAVVSD